MNHKIPENQLDTCYLGLGSNQNLPRQQLTTAIQQLEKQNNVNVITVSKYYQSKPLGEISQADFINCVVKIETTLSPINLMHACQKIELAQNKDSKVHWGPRTIDIDILLYGDNLHINSSNLTIPHPHMYDRDFVLQPLAEIEDNLILPNGISVQACLEKCQHKYIYAILDDNN